MSTRAERLARPEPEPLAFCEAAAQQDTNPGATVIREIAEKRLANWKGLGDPEIMLKKAAQTAELQKEVDDQIDLMIMGRDVGDHANQFIREGAPQGGQPICAVAAGRTLLDKGFTENEVAHCLWLGLRRSPQMGAHPWKIKDALAMLAAAKTFIAPGKEPDTFGCTLDAKGISADGEAFYYPKGDLIITRKGWQRIVDSLNVADFINAHILDTKSDRPSKNIVSMHHGADISVLFILFKSGDVYAFGNVPIDLATEFEVEAKLPEGSLGTLFHELIRKHPERYPFAKLPRPNTQEGAASS